MDDLGDDFFLGLGEGGMDLTDVDLGDTVVGDIMDAPEELQKELISQGQYGNVGLSGTFMAKVLGNGNGNGNGRRVPETRPRRKSQPEKPQFRHQEFRNFDDGRQYYSNYSSASPLTPTLNFPPPPVHPSRTPPPPSMESSSMRPPPPRRPSQQLHQHPPSHNNESPPSSYPSEEGGLGLPGFIRRPKSTPPVFPPFMHSMNLPPSLNHHPNPVRAPPRNQQAMTSMEKFFDESDTHSPIRRRVFRTVYNTVKFENTKAVVYLKTRRENRSLDVDDRLYSSLKYEIQLEVSGDVQGHVFFPVFFLIGKVSIVDSLNIKKVVRPGGVLKGITDCSLTNQGGKGLLTGILQVQFIGLSYYHEKKEFCLQIELFDKDDLMNPVMVLRSPSFRIYSRKPTKKRKRAPGIRGDDDRGFLVKRRANDTSTPYQRFQESFKDMIENFDMIQNNQERNNALHDLKEMLDNKMKEMGHLPQFLKDVKFNFNDI